MKKYLKLYKKWMITGKLPDLGLCSSLENAYDDIFLLFLPTREEMIELRKEGFCSAFWASGVPITCDERTTIDFTPLRQTIVLFMAAINDEL